jgi:hypothetical protein
VLLIDHVHKETDSPHIFSFVIICVQNINALKSQLHAANAVLQKARAPDEINYDAFIRFGNFNADQVESMRQTQEAAKKGQEKESLKTIEALKLQLKLLEAQLQELKEVTKPKQPRAAFSAKVSAVAGISMIIKELEDEKKLIEGATDSQLLKTEVGKKITQLLAIEVGRNIKTQMAEKHMFIVSKTNQRYNQLMVYADTLVQEAQIKLPVSDEVSTKGYQSEIRAKLVNRLGLTVYSLCYLLSRRS